MEIRRPENLGLAGGSNIALKVPEHLFQETLRFYRDVLGLPPARNGAAFQFGEGSPPRALWLDKTSGLARSDVWLEIRTHDVDRARAYFLDQKVMVAEGLEELPAGYQGFWIVDPAGIVHLVSKYGE